MRKIKSKIQKPSEDFYIFLEMVNLMRGVDMPSYSALVKNYEPECIEKWGSSHETRHKAMSLAGTIIFSFILKSPEQFKDYLYGNESPLNTDRLLNAYESFRNNRQTLEHVVDVLTRRNNDKQDSASLADKETFIAIDSRHVVITLDSIGQFNYEVIGFDLFKNFDFRRFKICPICNDIFWAARLDKKACSKCSNIYRQREFQNRNKAEINERRRENYKNKKQGVVK